MKVWISRSQGRRGGPVAERVFPLIERHWDRVRHLFPFGPENVAVCGFRMGAAKFRGDVLCRLVSQIFPLLAVAEPQDVTDLVLD